MSLNENDFMAGNNKCISNGNVIISPIIIKIYIFYVHLIDSLSTPLFGNATKLKLICEKLIEVTICYL